MEKRESSCTVGGNTNLYSHCGEQYGDSIKNLRIKLPYCQAILLLYIYPEKTTIQKGTCAPVFISALFTRARTWNQPRCPSTDEWMKRIGILLNHQFSSVQSLSRVRLCGPMNCSMLGLPVHHQIPEFTHTHVHQVGDAIQPSHPLSSPSPPAPNPSQHQSLFQ